MALDIFCVLLFKTCEELFGVCDQLTAIIDHVHERKKDKAIHAEIIFEIPHGFKGCVRLNDRVITVNAVDGDGEDSLLAGERFFIIFGEGLNHVKDEKVIDIRIIVNEEKGKARISVFNTGKQIPQEDIGQIWNKFYKVDKARTREYGGHGIGLSIVKAIMESFHQEYGVINYENGVAFWFELDLK